MFNYQLEKDEILFLHDNSTNISGNLERKNVSLILTNKNLIVEYKMGIFKRKKIEEVFPLSDLQQYNGIPCVEIEKSNEEEYEEEEDEDDGEKKLVVCFERAQLNIVFTHYDDINEYLEIWKNNIVRAHQDTVLSSASKIDKVCPSCGQKLFANAEFCTNCGTKLFKSNPNATFEITIDRQIELLTKLKALVDNGVISQVEFEQKKKELL